MYEQAHTVIVHCSFSLFLAEKERERNQERDKRLLAVTITLRCADLRGVLCLIREAPNPLSRLLRK